VARRSASARWRLVEWRYQATIAEFAQKPEKEAWANCEAALQEFESTD
jgi:hypothetical protein